MHPELFKLAPLVRSEIDELITPVESVLSSTSERDSTLNAREFIAFGCFVFATQISQEDSFVTSDEVALIRDIGRLIFENHTQNSSENRSLTLFFENTTESSYAEKIQDLLTSRPELYKGIKIPDPMIYAAHYDNSYGTNYLEKAKTLFWHLANIVLKADGKISKDEEKILVDIQTLLFSYELPKKNANTDIYNSPEFKAITPKRESRSLEELMQELNSLTGLESVKKDIKELVNFIKVQQLREEKGLKAVQISKHLVFTGNPGTGKTTTARLVSDIYKCLHVVSKGNFVETDRSGLVGGYTGQTALKVKAVVTESIGGVLFIDEAYSLFMEKQDSFGREAVDTLLKLMEDNRDDLIVIVAGYTGKMEEFLSSNPGLKSRFNKFILFEDYSPDEITVIFENLCKNAGYNISPEARYKVKKVLELQHENRDETFGNARLARNLFEKSVSNQASRIVSIPFIADEVLVRLEAVDIPEKG